MKRICSLITKYMAVIVLLVAACAFLWPAVLGHIKTSWVTPLLGAVMFGMGLTLELNDFKNVFSRPKDVIIGCLCQFTIMPLLAVGLSWVFKLPQELAIGVILVGCCPGGTSSNVITYLSKGDVALSVGMTGLSTILAPLLTPLLVKVLAGTMVPVDVMGMFLSIIEVIIVPISLGLIVKKIFPKVTSAVTEYLPAFSTIVITMIVAAVVSANSASLHKSGLLVIAVVILHNLSGYALGFGVGKALKLSPQKSTAISVEVGMQNSGLACSLAASHFAALAMASVPGAIFSVWHNISGALISRIFSKQNS
ncbi:MAG: bile acid:sodium symporter family protein [Bacteroidales bacterium]|nr:bile acid:sodium symporter family protein [Bacteroidales bacterium]